MRRTFPQMLSAVLLLAFSSHSIAQVGDIRGAEITVKSKTVSTEVVTLENQRDSFLVAWQIGLIKDGRLATIYSSDFSQYATAASSSGAIGPKQRRVVDINPSGQDIDASTLRLVVFEDGYIEGVAEAVDHWQKQRRERADDAQFWIRAFEGIPVGTDADVRRYLELRVAERAAQTSDDPSGLRSQVSQALARSRESGRLVDLVPRVSLEASRKYEALTRRPATAPTLETSAPVVMSSRRDSRPQFSVVITNLRDVPIEAVGFELLDPITRQPRSGQTSDFCGMDIGSAAGRIGARDARELPLFVSAQEMANVPIVRLTFVMFDDLTYEGSVQGRAGILAQRERQADDISYALSVRAEAASKPPGELIPFINAKRIERAKALATEGRQIRLDYFDDMIREAQTASAQLTDASRVQRLETRRAQLLRHLKQ